MLLLTLVASCVFFLTNLISVQAATPVAVNYSLSPEQANNQADPKVGYYDLKVKPGQKETIKFKINNLDTQTHTYNIAVNRATTDINGVIVYNQHNVKKDRDLKYNIENLVSYPKTATVNAKTSKEISVKINAPESGFKGELLGGILVDENNQSNVTKAAKGVTLKNKYDYVLGLQLQESTNPTKSDLKLINDFQTSDQGQIYIAAEMDNDVPKLEKNVDVSAKITPKNSSKVILKSSKNNMSIAPDSDFDYPVDVNTVGGRSRNNRLKPGTYTMHLNVKANNGKNLWNLKRNFVITRKENKQINKKTPNRSKDIWIILVSIIILIVIAGSVIFIYRRKQR